MRHLDISHEVVERYLKLSDFIGAMSAIKRTGKAKRLHASDPRGYVTVKRRLKRREERLAIKRSAAKRGGS